MGEGVESNVKQRVKWDEFAKGAGIIMAMGME
jgi:hypothetical protein